MKPVTAGIVGTIGVVIAYCVLTDQSRQPNAPLPGGAAAAREADVQEMTRGVLQDALPTPATIKYVSTRPISSENGRHIVHAVLDAQNVFGALVRQSLCVCFEERPDGKYVYDKEYGVQRCSNPPEKREIETIKTMNRWK